MVAVAVAVMAVVDIAARRFCCSAAGVPAHREPSDDAHAEDWETAHRPGRREPVPSGASRLVALPDPRRQPSEEEGHGRRQLQPEELRDQRRRWGVLLALVGATVVAIVVVGIVGAIGVVGIVIVLAGSTIEEAAAQTADEAAAGTAEAHRDEAKPDTEGNAEKLGRFVVRVGVEAATLLVGPRAVAVPAVGDTRRRRRAHEKSRPQGLGLDDGRGGGGGGGRGEEDLYLRSFPYFPYLSSSSFTSSLSLLFTLFLSFSPFLLFSFSISSLMSGARQRARSGRRGKGGACRSSRTDRRAPPARACSRCPEERRGVMDEEEDKEVMFGLIRVIWPLVAVWCMVAVVGSSSFTHSFTHSLTHSLTHSPRWSSRRGCAGRTRECLGGTPKPTSVSGAAQRWAR